VRGGLRLVKCRLNQPKKCEWLRGVETGLGVMVGFIYSVLLDILIMSYYVCILLHILFPICTVYSRAAGGRRAASELPTVAHQREA
jgi:hypothetical protein